MADAKNFNTGTFLRTLRRALWIGVTISFLLIVFAAAGYAQLDSDVPDSRAQRPVHEIEGRSADTWVEDAIVLGERFRRSSDTGRSPTTGDTKLTLLK